MQVGNPSPFSCQVLDGVKVWWMDLFSDLPPWCHLLLSSRWSVGSLAPRYLSDKTQELSLGAVGAPLAVSSSVMAGIALLVDVFSSRQVFSLFDPSLPSLTLYRILYSTEYTYTHVQPGIQSDSQDRLQSYTEKLCLDKPRKRKKKKIICFIESGRIRGDDQTIPGRLEGTLTEYGSYCFSHIDFIGNFSVCHLCDKHFTFLFGLTVPVQIILLLSFLFCRGGNKADKDGFNDLPTAFNMQQVSHKFLSACLQHCRTELLC